MSTTWGAAFGLLTALSWATASLLFSRAPVPAAALNLFKNILSGVLLLAVVGGIAIGMAVTLVGVIWVIRERTSAAEGAGHFPGSTLRGALCGGLAAACQALGAAWSKAGILRLEAVGIPTEGCALRATLMRVLVAVVVGLLLAATGRRLRPWTRAVTAPGALRVLIPASLIGAFLGLWLSMLSFQLTTVAIATTLAATTPIFILPLVVLVLRQRVSTRAVLGASVAVAGVVVLFSA